MMASDPTCSGYLFRQLPAVTAPLLSSSSSLPPLDVIPGLRTATRLFGGSWWGMGEGGLALKTSYSFCHEGTSDVATS